MKNTKIIFRIALVLSSGLFGCSTTQTIPAEKDAMRWGEEYSKADAQMNRVYQKMLAGSSAAWQAKLRNSQQAWIIYRDAEVKLVSQDWEGGSGQTAAVYCVLAELSRNRIRELQERYR